MTDEFTDGTTREATHPSGEDAPFPLTYTQERMWLEEQLRPGGTAYHMPVVSRVSGPLDVAALRRAVDGVAARHSALRTVFAEADGAPVQRVLPSVELPVAVLDLRAEDDPEGAARAAVLDEARRPFDLAAGPLLRFLAVRTADEEHLLVVTAHHLVSDGASFGLLFAELSERYADAHETGTPCSHEPGTPRARELDSAVGQFADSARREREQPEDGLLDWWQEYLDGAPRTLELPADRPRALGGHRAGAEVRRALSPALSEGVRELGRTQRATLFMTALTAFGVVLGRQTGRDDLLVGTPVSSRRAAEQRTLGCFLNSLPVRLDLSGGPSFADLVARVKRSALDAFGHQRAPLHRLSADRAPGGDGGRGGPVQVFFNVLPPAAPLELAGCAVEQLPFPGIDAKFDLTLYVSAEGGRIVLDAVYDSGLFLPERVADLLEQVEAVLAQAVADPARPVAALSLATGRATALAPGLDGALSASYPGSVPERLDEHARLHPERPALEGPGRTWTYAELAAASASAAARLRALGVGPGDVVAVHADRSPLTVLALLAALRAGAAFSVLDASYPEAELALRAAELKPAAWIEAAAGRSTAAFATAPVLALDGLDRLNGPDRPDRPDGDPFPGGEVPAARPAADDPAYVAFTSGTTGRPRRILGAHGPLAHFLAWYAEEFRIGAGDRFSVLSGLGHDPFLRDVLAPLWAGATAVLPGADPRDTGALAASLREDRITVAHLTPALAAALADAEGADGGGWPELRLAGFGGDVLTHGTVRAWAALAPGADLLNLYGATETPQAVSVHLVRRGGEPAPDGEGPVPLGPGIDEVQLLVVAGERLAGIGELGELVVRTPHLARYADVVDGSGFTALPFAPGSAYRTGDLARLRPDGLFDHAGRADDQVKVRGFRVEPAEVEAALTGLEGVRRAVVLAEPEPHGGHRLVAHLVTGGARPDLGALRAALVARLAEYKVPSAFVVHDALPLTAHGKPDRSALRARGREESAVGGYVAPRGPLERELAGIWREVLGLERVGTRDDFFALGGHSLLLGRVLVRVRRTLGAELSLGDLFRHPTIASLAGLVRDAGFDGGTGSAQEVPRGPVDAPAPLSWTQERLWLEEQLRPGDAAYNMPLVLRLRGPLDADALQAAVDAVVRRHAVLRTGFALEDGSPVQRVTPGARVPVRARDLRGAADPSAAALAAAMAETKEPFDLAAGPLLRALALRTGEDEHLLVLTVHHIVFDGWSFGVLLDDLSAAYRTAVRGGAPDLGTGLQFTDAARWQRETLDGPPLEELVAWWTGELAGVPTVLELPTDRPRPAVQAHRGARHRLALGPELSTRIRELSRERGSTLYLTLLSAFGVVLSRHTGQERLLVGTPVANRERAEFEDLVGCFLNTVPLALDLRGEPDFGTLLERVTGHALAAFEHQGVPFARLVAALAPERDLSRSPLTQALFALQNVRLGSFDAPGVTSELVEVSEANSQFDLALRMLDDGEEVIGWLDYDTDLFDAETAERLAGHLLRVLRAVTEAPGTPVAAVDLLGADERDRVVARWNATDADWDLERTLTSLLEERAGLDRVAVRCGEEQLTYPELHRRANRLAHHLRDLGVGPDVVVGVHLERSVELIVALLAVLKAGGAYLPLDPGYPAGRLEFMLADARVPVLLTGPGTDTAALAGDDVTVLVVDAEAGAGRPDHAPAPLAGPDHLAYVIYTSGSTGRPKGVQVPHRGIVNRLLWMQDAYRLDASDTVLQKTPISFDVSVWELFWPLLTGARQVLAKPGGHRDPDYLARLVQDERVSVCHFVPPMLDTFLSAAPAGRCASLRLVVCSGEALPAELARRLHLALPGAALENLYGPTEASVDVTRWSSRPGWDRPSVPIGAPIANTRVYVLDRLMAPVPIGVAGELLLGGVQLARAYGDRPDLTADRFVPDPFGAPGARLYRTGDLARWRPDGTVEYLGRIDHQVKVRGFRIELGEIEAALTGQAGVGQAVVMVREDAPGDRRIVAYLTAAPGGAVPGRPELRTGLGRLLPEHMVPSAFVVLDRLPLSPNGKVDRGALPAPEAGRPAGAEFVAPRDAAERTLTGLWQQVLRLDRVGVTDNFFEIGGDSMHAVRVVGLAREQGLDIPLTELFAHQTVEAVAAWLASRTERVTERRQVAAFGLLSAADLAKLRAK
ncbi:amino acid adenylation domain-containing protein [Streptomyces sp. NPDC001941]|uniref:amino acid adenylation domain-containing protein n=1 Tax=Streptomyces sp. NPDC001941 TaxID=3154659 RepID=UPI00331A2F26